MRLSIREKSSAGNRRLMLKKFHITTTKSSPHRNRELTLCTSYTHDQDKVEHFFNNSYGVVPTMLKACRKIVCTTTLKSASSHVPTESPSLPKCISVDTTTYYKTCILVAQQLHCIDLSSKFCHTLAPGLLPPPWDS